MKTYLYRASNLNSTILFWPLAIASVYSEKTRLKKMIMIIIIMNLSQEMTVSGGYQKLTSAMKLRPEK